jgi:hypothetical protein
MSISNHPHYLEPGRRTAWTGPAVYTYHNTNLFTAHERLHFSAALRSSIYDMSSNERFRSIASESSCSHYLASYFCHSDFLFSSSIIGGVFCLAHPIAMIPQLWTELICLFVFMFPAPEEVYFYHDKKKLPVVSVISKGNLEREERREPKRL